MTKEHPLAGFKIAVTGDFGPTRNESEVKLRIENNGGIYMTDINPNVSHLICSTTHYQIAVNKVKQAKSVKHLKIVTLDWLEDSLQLRNPKKPDQYLLSKVSKKSGKKKAKKKAIRLDNIKAGLAQYQKQNEEFVKYMDSDGYHIYRDSTGFAYDITIARIDIKRNQNERWSLKLYETIEAPRLYACYARFSSPVAPAELKVVAPLASRFELAFELFQRFFALKTKQDWNQRFNKTQIEDESKATSFLYTPPKEGPCGIIRA